MNSSAFVPPSSPVPAPAQDVSAILASVAAAAESGNLVFPTTAELSLKVQRLIDDPDCSIDSLAKLVQADPVLAARVVAVANSVIYNRSGRGVADVSGLGIAAALLVNTINTIFMQQRHVADQPALLMQNMNSALYPHLREQFVTAAYCVVDRGSVKIRIAQAGHPPIYLLRRGEPQLLRAKPKGRFFGFEEHLHFETV